MTARWDFSAHCPCTWTSYSARCRSGWHRLLATQPGAATTDLPAAPQFTPRKWRRK